MFHATVLAHTTDLATLFEPRAGAARAGIDRAPERPQVADTCPAAAAPGGGAPASEEVAIAARSALAQARDGAHPFVRERMSLVPAVLAMMADEDWCLGGQQRRRARALVDDVRAAAVPIPDRTPVVGLMDDAILMDRWLVALHDELADWHDYRAFRAEQAAARGVALADCHPSRQRWLAERTRAWARARARQSNRRADCASAVRPSCFRVG